MGRAWLTSRDRNPPAAAAHPAFDCSQTAPPSAGRSGPGRRQRPGRAALPTGTKERPLLRATTPRDAVVQLAGTDDFLFLTALSERAAFVLHCRVNCGPPSPGSS